MCPPDLPLWLVGQEFMIMGLRWRDLGRFVVEALLWKLVGVALFAATVTAERRGGEAPSPLLTLLPFAAIFVLFYC